MESSTLLEIARQLVSEYQQILLVDPYYKIDIFCTTLERPSECVESKFPATWDLTLDPEKHIDEYDIRLSAIDAVLKILFRDIQQNNKRDEVISKLTNSIARLTSITDDEEEDLAQDDV